MQTYTPQPNLFNLTLLFVVYLFILLSRLHEVFLPIPKLMLVLGLISVVLTIVSSGLIWIVTYTVGRLLILFTALMFLAGICGYWVSGSLELIVFNWIPALIVFLIGAPMMTGAPRVRTAFYTIALASTCLGLTSIVRGASILDRLTGAGTFDDPNDLAAILLFGIPGWLLLLITSRNVLVKIVGCTAVFFNVAVALRTGSRGGLISLVLLSVAIFLSVSGAKKLLATVAAVVITVVALISVPDSVTSRYRTMLNDDGGATLEDTDSLAARAAHGSVQARTELLKSSLLVTLQHPMLGAGPGNFMLADNENADLKGVRRRWQQTHNSYTQVSADLGIGGLILYVGVLISCFRVCRSVLRAQKVQSEDTSQTRSVALCTLWTLIVFCGTSCFLSIAYTFYLPTLATLAVGLRNSSSGPVLQTQIASVNSGETGTHKQRGWRGPSIGQEAPKRSLPGTGAARETFSIRRGLGSRRG